VFIFSHLNRTGDEGVQFLGAERTGSEYFCSLIVLQVALVRDLFFSMDVRSFWSNMRTPVASVKNLNCTPRFTK
jgi:hypothetical protein